MMKYILKKITLSIPLVFGITILDFILMNVMGSPLELLIGPKVSAGAIAAKSAAFGLDKPIYIQYFYWLKEIFSGNFGTSIRSNQPVLELIIERTGPTILLMGTALIISLILAFPIAIYSSSRKASKSDFIISGFSFLGISIPTFFLSLVFIYFFTIKLGWLPSSGMTTPGAEQSVSDVLRHMILPVSVLVVSTTGSNIRYIRASMIEVLSQDYIVTAESKGVGRFIVIYKHALRNALIPMITIIGMQIPVLFSGAVVIEQVFSWPGLGLTTMAAILNRDYPVIMGICLISALIVIISNLIVDIVYALANPKIKYR